MQNLYKSRCFTFCLYTIRFAPWMKNLFEIVIWHFQWLVSKVGLTGIRGFDHWHRVHNAFYGSIYNLRSKIPSCLWTTHCQMKNTQPKLSAIQSNNNTTLSTELPMTQYWVESYFNESERYCVKATGDSLSYTSSMFGLQRQQGHSVSSLGSQ